jgi:RNA polymerase sigma-54 factor
MAITPKLELRQGQSLVMTPQLQQAIKLLQFSSLEIAAYVEQELERNPLLERADGGESGGETREDTPEAEGAALDGAASVQDATTDSALRDSGSGLDADFEAVFPDAAPGDGAEPGFAESSGIFPERRGGNSFDEENASLEQVPGRELTLREHLLAQMAIEIPDPIDRAIGASLIDQIDEAGYLAGSLAETAARLNCPLQRAEGVLERLQRFDPPGIAARSLKECLALQLKDRNRYDPAIAKLLDHLDLLARRDTAQLMRLCGVDAEDMADMIRELKRLDPKPGLTFDRPVLQTMIPDVFVRRDGEGGWRIELNNDTLPRVLVNMRYLASIDGKAKDKAARTYLSECLASANWLVRSLDQRANTILKVSTEIVRQQEAFFNHGVRHLRPLNLRAIAEAINMHESTVSRVTTSKYMATPRGIFELKYFFTASIAAADGGAAHSAEAVRHRIRDLIANEPEDAVLSDDQIVDILRRSGIDIARRTVAKYREALRLPSSVQRRRAKGLDGRES